jgi:hypothetical protein
VPCHATLLIASNPTCVFHSASSIGSVLLCLYCPASLTIWLPPTLSDHTLCHSAKLCELRLLACLLLVINASCAIPAPFCWLCICLAGPAAAGLSSIARRYSFCRCRYLRKRRT